jgi:type III secretion protein S
MDTETTIQFMREALFLAALVATPAVIASVIVGLLMAVLQAATQIQDQSIGQGLKLGAVILVLAVAGGWMGALVYRFAHNALLELPNMVSPRT